MNLLVSSLIFITLLPYSFCGPLRLQKRAAFYIANETACVVDNTVYSNGDPIPTDDPCEACKCRPPGFACVLKDCEVKPGCRAVRRAGHCCPEYICGCEHNGRMYRDGDEIRDSQNPCYTCHCQGSSIACAFMDCFFRVDCAPEYVPGECCPHYTNCTAPKNSFDGKNPYLNDKEPSLGTTLAPSSIIVPGVSYVEETTESQNMETATIEIFEAETKQPEILQFVPDAISIIDRIVSEEFPESVEEPTEISSKEEIIPIQPGSPDIETSPVEADKNVDLKVDEATTEIQYTTEQSVTHDDIFTSRTNLDLTENPEHPIEITLPSEAPLLVENVDVEPEEPNNNLETGSLSSDYGKSLKFDETKESGIETVLKEQESKNLSQEQNSESEPKEQNNEPGLTEKNESSTEQESDIKTKEQENSTQSQNLLYFGSSSEIFTTKKVQDETVSPTSVKMSTTTDEKIIIPDSTEKIPFYAGKDSLKTESVETVETVAEIKEQTTVPIENNPDLSIASTVAESLFNFNRDKLEDQKSSIEPEVTNVKTDSTIKTGDVELKESSKEESLSTHAETVLSETVLSTTISQVDDKITTVKID